MGVRKEHKARFGVHESPEQRYDLVVLDECNT